MKPPPVRRCSACWSSLDAAAVRCSQCGAAAPADAGESPRGWGAALAGAVAVAALAGLLTWVLRGRETPAPAPEEAGPQGTDPASRPQAAERPEPAPAAKRTRHHVLLTTNEPGVAIGLVLASRTDSPAVFLPLGLFPLEGELTDVDGKTVDLRGVTADPRYAFVLLAAQGALPGAPEPLSARASTTLVAGETLHAIAPDGTQLASNRVVGRTQGGLLLRLEKHTRAAAVLVDGEHRAVAYALGEDTALPLDAALPWLQQPGRLSLTDLQKELRAQDPEWLYEDARRLLEGTPSELALRDALARLERAFGMARERKLVDALQQALRIAHHALVKAIAPRDPPAAIAHAREALLRFPDDPALLSSLCLLVARHGDPTAAADLYLRLAQVSADHAREIAGELQAAFLREARERQRQRRSSEALAILARAVELFPRDADLRAEYAALLAQARRYDEALAQAGEAARLDPGRESELRQLQELANRAGSERSGVRVEIPFDPTTHVLRMPVQMGGVPIELVVDTGASLTTIPSQLADQLGLRKPGNPKVKVTTAGGVVEAELVTVPNLSLGEIEVRNVRAAVLDLPESLAGKGLLGMNVLQTLNLEIDSQRSVLVLRRGSRRR